MDLLKHLPSPISPSFSEALRIDTQAGCWIFVAGQVGVPLPPDKGSVTFEQEVRTTFERIRDSLSKLGAGMNHVVSIKTYLTDLGPYAVFSRLVVGFLWRFLACSSVGGSRERHGQRGGGGSA